MLIILQEARPQPDPNFLNPEYFSKVRVKNDPCPLCSGTGGHNCSNGKDTVYVNDRYLDMKEDLAERAKSQGIEICNKDGCGWPVNHAFHLDHVRSDKEHADALAKIDNIKHHTFSSEDNPPSLNVMCINCGTFLNVYDEDELNNLPIYEICSDCGFENILENDKVTKVFEFDVRKGRSSEELKIDLCNRMAKWKKYTQELKIKYATTPKTSWWTRLGCKLLGHLPLTDARSGELKGGSVCFEHCASCRRVLTDTTDKGPFDYYFYPGFYTEKEDGNG